MTNAAEALDTARAATWYRYRGDADRDDIAQEVALRIITEWDKRPNGAMNKQHQRAAAKLAIRAIESHERKWTGGNTVPGKSSDVIRKGLTGPINDATPHPLAVDAFTAAEWATLRPRILHAIDSLPNRQRKMAERFYAGETVKEAAASLGTTFKSAATAWKRARTQLAEELDDLRGLVA